MVNKILISFVILLLFSATHAGELELNPKHPDKIDRDLKMKITKIKITNIKITKIKNPKIKITKKKKTNP